MQQTPVLPQTPVSKSVSVFVFDPGLFMLIATVLMLTLMAPPSQAAGSNMKTESKTPPDLNFPEITLCHPEAVIAHYLLDDPPSCEEITAETTQTFEADIFHPQPMLIDIPTAACSIEKIHFASTYYFFGAQTTVKGNPIRTPATANRCSDWKEKKYDPELGPLASHYSHPEFFKTSNKVTPKYNWPGTNYGSVSNALMTHTFLSFNTHSHRGQHLLDPILNCRTEEGYCESDTTIYLFDKFQLTCHTAQHIPIFNTSVLVHQLTDRNFFQVPRIDLAFSAVVKCPKRVEDCYSNIYSTIRCTTTHYVIASTSAKASLLDLKPFTTHTPNVNPNYSATSNDQALIFTQTFDSLAHNLDLQITKLRDDILRLQCANTRVQLVNLRSSQLINPSATLSVLLNREAYATMGTTTLQEISCSKTTAVMRPSLWVEGRLASHPIFTVYYENRSMEAQLTSGKYLRWGLFDFIPPHTGFMLFNIQGRLFSFLNGTLQSDHPPTVTKIGVERTSIELLRTVIDTEAMAETFNTVSSTLGIEQLQQSLRALISINRVQYAATGVDTQGVEEFVNQPGSKTKQHNFLSTIREKFTEKFSLLFTGVRWFSLVCEIALIIFIFYYLIGCINHFHVKRIKSRTPSENTKDNQTELKGNFQNIP